jgi:AI-2 transport protein TqsA
LRLDAVAEADSRPNTASLPAVPRFLIIAAALVLVIAGMRAARPILIPLMVAFFLAVLSLPLLRWLAARRLPAAVAVFVTVLTDVLVVGSLIYVVSRALTDFVNALPRYVLLLQVQVDNLLLELRQRGIDTTYWDSGDLVNPGVMLDFAQGALRGVASFLATTVLVLIILIFILAEASGFGYKMRLAMGRHDADLSRFARITLEVQRFLGIKTLTSISTGILIGVWTWLMGLDFPLLWGLLAFLFNYIPSVGSIIAAVPAIVVALLQFDLSRAVAVAAGYLAVNITIGNLIEPNVMGRRLGLSPLVVVLSLVFWGWVLGPVGMFLSVPLTVIVKIMLENTEDFRWVAVLLDSPRGKRPAEPPGAVQPQSPLA